VFAAIARGEAVLTRRIASGDAVLTRYSNDIDCPSDQFRTRASSELGSDIRYPFSVDYVVTTVV